MADVAQTLALITLAQRYAGGVVRQVNRSCPTLRMLNVVPGSGQNIAWAPESSGAVAESYADGADAANFGSDAQASAVIPWALLRGNSRVTGLAEATAATANDPVGNTRLLARNVTNSLAALASLVNQQLYSGNGAATPAQITGLNSAIGDDTNTYAGVNRATSTYFQPHVVDPGTPTAISQGQIRSDITEIYTQSGEYPDIAPCAPAVFNSILGMFDSRQQLVRTIDTVSTAKGNVALSGNYKGIEVEGVVFIKDKDATAGSIYYLNTNYVDIVALIQPMLAEFGFTPGIALTANDGLGEVPLMAVVEALGKAGDSKKYQAKTYLNLRVTRPNACGVRKNVLTA